MLWQNAFPVFGGAKPFLTISASLSSFLLLGVIFSRRHSIARQFFPGLHVGPQRVAHASELRRARVFGWFPTVLWIFALFCLTLYFNIVDNAVESIAYAYSVSVGGTDQQPDYRCRRLPLDAEALTIDASFKDFSSPREHKIVITCWMEKQGQSLQRNYSVRFPEEGSVQAILKGTPSISVPYRTWMGIFFLGSFVCAAAAFVLTGLKDYLQSELGLSDRDLILAPPVASRRERFDVQGVPGLYGIVEYSPEVPGLLQKRSGPFCAWHDKEPKPAGIDPTSGEVSFWKHVTTSTNKTEETLCQLQTHLTIGELERLFHESAERTTAREDMKRSGNAGVGNVNPSES
jgi:hypothetical protein